jgi:hypothetical protein
MQLAASQHSFLASLFRGGTPPAWLAESARGFAVYRASYLANHVEALRDVYPVIDRLLGRDCFTALAGSYLAEHPSTHADLHRFGAGFANHLRPLEALAALPYLPDVARLEWLAHGAFHAADAPAPDLARLAAVPPERHGGLRCHPHPSVRLMLSDFPVHRIWQTNQPGWSGADRVDLDGGGVALAIHREGLDIALQPLAPGAFALLGCFLAGHDLARGIDALLAADPEADPGAALHGLLRHGLVVDFSD